MNYHEVLVCYISVRACVRVLKQQRVEMWQCIVREMAASTLEDLDNPF